MSVPYVTQPYGDRQQAIFVIIVIESDLNQYTVQTFTESENTRYCVNTIFPPDDGHVNARNMSRIIV
jgi:hypothetical protein